MTKRVFISKPNHEVAELKTQLDSSDIRLVSESFISFQPASFKIEKEIDIIFFGSIRSVIFLQANLDLGNAKSIACIGAKTASTLNELGYSVEFVGTKAGNPSEVASEFEDWCGGRKVLFPISSRSLKSISSSFPPSQIEEAIVYKTELVKKKIQNCDIYIFTSPSNVEGFLLENSLPESCEVIAWGNSTKNALTKLDIDVKYCLKQSSMEELTKLLK